MGNYLEEENKIQNQAQLRLSQDLMRNHHREDQMLVTQVDSLPSIIRRLLEWGAAEAHPVFPNTG